MFRRRPLGPSEAPAPRRVSGRSGLVGRLVKRGLGGLALVWLVALVAWPQPAGVLVLSKTPAGPFRFLRVGKATDGWAYRLVRPQGVTSRPHTIWPDLTADEDVRALIGELLPVRPATPMPVRWVQFQTISGAVRPR